MHLYTGLRQKSVRLLMRAPCVGVEAIEITEECQIFLEGERLSQDEGEGLAARDGFGSFSEMMAFWDKRRPFHGHVYHWDPQRRIT